MSSTDRKHSNALGDIHAIIAQALEAALQPTFLRIDNVSHKHQGHAESPGTGQSHWHIVVVASAFAGQTRLVRHRQVNALLAPAYAAGAHAISLRLLAPDEADASST